MDRRDLLILSLLLHDVGKGMPVENHVTGSLQALETAADRLKLSPEEKAEVHFLIEHHLDMSATVQRRDIFDPATVSGFASTVNTQRAVAATLPVDLCGHPRSQSGSAHSLESGNALAAVRLDLQSLQPHVGPRPAARFRRSAVAGTSAHSGRGRRQERNRAVPGWISRAATWRCIPPAEIAAHFALYQKLGAEPVQTEIKKAHHTYALTLLSADRPALFATIAGVLAAWGMNIVKADAFANAAGVVLDTFHFVDLHRTLELNPGEVVRFQQSIADVLNGRQALEPLLKGRLDASVARVPKVLVATAINFDESSSDHCTLDRSGDAGPPRIVVRDRFCAGAAGLQH